MLSGCRKIGAIVSRELYGYLASPVAYVFIVIFLAITGFFTFMLGRFFEAGQASLESFFVWHPWLYMFLVPAIGMRLWAEERRSGTIELLFTLPLSHWHAVIGKYLAGCVIMALSLLLTFPMVIMVNRLGQPDVGAIAAGYLGSLLVAMAFLAISGLTSALTRSQVVSFIIAWAICLLLILCGWPPVTNLLRQGSLVPSTINFVIWYGIVFAVLGVVIVAFGKAILRIGETISIWVMSLLFSLATIAIVIAMYMMSSSVFERTFSGGTPEWLVHMISRFSVTPYFEQVKIGVIDTRSLIYFLSIIVFALFCTGLALHRRRQGWGVSLVGVGVMAVLLIFVNYAAGAIRLKADLTEGKLYTLSDGSRMVVDSISTPVTIRLYYSRTAKDLPLQIKEYATRVEDFLREYVEAANGGILLERVDPKPDTEDEDKALNAGMTPMPLGNGDSFYLGMVVRCLDAEVVLPMLAPFQRDNLEYDITHAIHGVIKSQKTVLGLMTGIKVTGDEQPNPMLGAQGQRPPWQFLSMIKNDYEVQEIPLTVTEIPPEIEHLLVIHPKDISDAAQYALDQFVLRGGKLIALVDGFCMADAEANPQMPWAPSMPGSSSLPRLFDAWGIDFAPGGQALFDLEYAFRFPNQMGQDQTLVGYVHLAEKGNSGHRTVSLLEDILLPLPGALRLSPVDGLEKTPLLESSEQAGMLDIGSMGGQQLMRLPYEQIAKRVREQGTGLGERMPLAVRIEGKFTTAFPDGQPDAGDEDAASDSHLATSEEATAVYVIGDVDFLYDDLWYNQVNYMNQRVAMVVRDNFYLVQNALDELTGGVDLIGLRSRSSTRRPLEKIEEMQRLAQEAFQAKILETEERLAEVEREIGSIRVVQRGNQLVFNLTEEQLAKLDELKEKRLELRKEMRQIRREQREDVEALQNFWIRFNIFLVPFLIAHFGIILALFRMRRKTSQKTITEG